MIYAEEIIPESQLSFTEMADSLGAKKRSINHNEKCNKLTVKNDAKVNKVTSIEKNKREVDTK